MALQATFTANFSQFDAAVKNAQKNVETFEFNVKGTQRALQTMVSSFDGSKLIREASLMTAAIEKVGGATKLTESEQRRLNTTLQETVAKFNALGQEAPADIKKVADEINRAVKAADELNERNKKNGESMLSLGGIAKTMGGVLAGAFTIGAIASFVKEVVNLGGQINDIAKRTGMSVEAVQELGYAAKTTGSSFEAIQSSSSKLSDKLIEQSKGTIEALRDIGLTIGQLQQMRPEDAFTAVADAIGEIKNPMQQTQLAMELFGKTGVELLPAMKEGFSDLRKQAHDLGQVMSEDAVKGLDDLGDAWDIFITGAKNSLGEFIADIVSAARRLKELIPADANTFKLPEGVSQADQYGSPAGFANALANAAARPPGELGRMRSSDIALPPDVVKSAADYVEQLKKVRAELAGLSETTKRQIVAGHELKQSEEDIGKAIAGQLKNRELATEVVKVYLEGLKDMEAQQKKLASMSMVADFQETIGKARQLAKEIDSGRISIKNLGDKQAEVNKLLREAEQAMKAVGATGDPLYRRISDLANATSKWGDMLPKVKHGIDDILNVANYAAAAKVPSGTLLDLMFGDLGDKLSNVKIGEIPNAGFKIDNADKQFADWFKEGRKSAIDLSGSLDDLSRAFAQLAQARPLDGWIQDVAELIGLMNVATQAGKGFADAIRKRDKDGKVITGPGAGFDWSVLAGSQGAGNAISAGMQLGQFGVSSYSAISQATDVQGRGNRALRGAATGASIGANPALAGATGGWSIVIGAVAGAIIGALRNPGFEQEMHRIANEFGVNIGEKLAREIDKLKKQFGGDRQAAEIFSLDKIIADAGGLSDQNFGKMTGKLRDVFSMVETGKFAVADARNVLDRSFALFAEHFQKGNEIASQSFQDIIRLNKEMGVNSEAVAAFVNSQTQALGGSVANLAAPLVEQYGGLSDSIDAARKEVEKLAASGGEGSKEHADAVANLNALLDLQKAGAAGASDEFERLGVIALGAFNAAVNAGADWLTAVENMGPALDTLIGLQKDLGLESQNAGLAELTRFRDLVNNNQSLVLGTQALGETMKALSSIGGITTETLAAMEGQGIQTFDRLVAAGFTENQALRQMRSFLLGVIDAHEQLGTPIDENTAKLIEMAEKQGILKDDGRDMAKTLKDGFADMKQGTDKLVGSIGLMVKALGADVPEAVQDAIDALSKIPTTIEVGVDVVYNDPGHTPDVPGGAGATWDGVSLRDGGVGNFGSGTLAMLHGKEAVIPLDQLSGGGGQRDLHVYVMLPNGRELAHEVVPYIPGVLDFHGATR